MLVKTSGLVVNFIRYKETSIIARILTEHHGIQSFMVNGVRSKKSKTGIALFQPLTVVELVMYFRDQQQIQRLNEIRCAYPYKSIPFDQKKTCITLFLGELIGKILPPQKEDQPMFLFLRDSMPILDLLEHGYENFHLQLLLKLSIILGLEFENGAFLLEEVQQSTALAEKIDILRNGNYGVEIALTNQQRRFLLDQIVQYYRIHLGSIHEIQSIDVLHEVFS